MAAEITARIVYTQCTSDAYIKIVMQKTNIRALTIAHLLTLDFIKRKLKNVSKIIVNQTKFHNIYFYYIILVCIWEYFRFWVDYFHDLQYFITWFELSNENPPALTKFVSILSMNYVQTYNPFPINETFIYKFQKIFIPYFQNFTPLHLGNTISTRTGRTISFSSYSILKKIELRQFLYKRYIVQRTPEILIPRSPQSYEHHVMSCCHFVDSQPCVWGKFLPEQLRIRSNRIHGIFSNIVDNLLMRIKHSCFWFSNISLISKNMIFLWGNQIQSNNWAKE